jgi:hypothetical protein
MPYLNKRNRFIQAAKTLAESNGIKADEFKKSDILAVANSINMKGIPTWVLKEYRSAVSTGVYDLTSLISPVTV